MPHVFQNFDFKQPQLLGAHGPIDLKGKWDELVFKNGKPIVLELACGRGEYAVNLGKAFPENNYIGIDIKGVAQLAPDPLLLCQGGLRVAQ